MDLVLLAQAIDLLCCILWHGLALLLGLPSALFAILNRTSTAQVNHAVPKVAGKGSLDTGTAGHEQQRRPQCCFYEGVVFHARMAPVKNSFR